MPDENWVEVVWKVFLERSRFHFFAKLFQVARVGWFGVARHAVSPELNKKPLKFCRYGKALHKCMHVYSGTEASSYSFSVDDDGQSYSNNG